MTITEKGLIKLLKRNLMEAEPVVRDATVSNDVKMVTGPSGVPEAQVTQVKADRFMEEQFALAVATGVAKSLMAHLGDNRNDVWDYLTKTQPEGMVTAAEALYRFDKDGDDVDRTGNGHDLTVLGIPLYAKRNGVIGIANIGAVRAYTPISAALQTAGSLTVEMVHAGHAPPASKTALFTVTGDPGLDTQVENTLIQLDLDSPTLRLGIFQEKDSGTDIVGSLNVQHPIGAMQHTVLTRAADGVSVKLYQNGDMIDEATLSSAPNGGANARLWIMGTSAVSYQGMMFSLKYTKDEFNSSQVDESYRRVRGLIS